MSSAICFILDQAEILSSDEGLFCRLMVILLSDKKDVITVIMLLRNLLYNKISSSM